MLRTVEAAERDSIRIRDVDVGTYSWGRGDDTVLLVHGWRGRASQFAPLVRELVAEGFHIVAFDAPAHGASGKDRTDIRDWIATIDALQQRHGRFRLIVGHSFGALAALAAVRAGTTTTRVATIAGTGTPQVLFDQFAAILGLAPRAKDAFLRRFHRRLDIDPEEMTRALRLRRAPSARARRSARDPRRHRPPDAGRGDRRPRRGPRRSARASSARTGTATTACSRPTSHSTPSSPSRTAGWRASTPPARGRARPTEPQAPRDPASVEPTSVRWKFWKERDAVGPR